MHRNSEHLHSRSLVIIHPRQFWFFDWMASQYRNDTFSQIYPSSWGTQTRWNGISVNMPGDMVNFIYESTRIKRKLEEEKPDILYIQQELYCRSTRQLILQANRLEKPPKVVVFAWENLNESLYDMTEASVFGGIDGMICGTREALDLVTPRLRKDIATEVFPQVGCNTVHFCPNANSSKIYDLIFVGRNAPNKGWDVIEKFLHHHPEITLLKVENASYPELVHKYNSAKVHVSPTIDTETWHEQWASFANCEALSCGLRCVASHTNGVDEYLIGVPGVQFCKQNDLNSFSRAVFRALKAWEQNVGGRRWLLDNVSYEEIGRKTYEVFKSVAD